MPIAMTQEQQGLQASLRDWAKRSGPLAVIRALEPTEGHGLPPPGTGLPADLADLGVFASEASYEFLLTRCLSIVGGTTQILLNQAAERVLGLPR